jgi:hypothetical protein
MTRSSGVTIGRYELTIGAGAGTLINAATADTAAQDPARLARALQEEPEKPPDRTPGVVAGSIVDAAGEATARAEEARALVTALLDGSLLRPPPERIDIMLELLQRLDAGGHWEETLRLARAINGLLALAMRWADLVRSLGVALRAADNVGDRSAIAWAQHELGTLHLAADDPLGAELALSQAHELRQRLGDRAGVAATEHNLNILCQRLRELLREGRLRTRGGRARRVLGLAAAAVLLLLVGAVARAVVIPPAADDTPKIAVRVIGRGTVTSAPPGIRCPPRCDAAFDRGASLLLTASARPGSSFAGWDGECHGTKSCSLDLDGERTVTARFDASFPTRTLKVHKAGGGVGAVKSEPSGIDCGGACVASFRRGTPIRLVAHPGRDAIFAGWSGGGCTGTGDCTVTLQKPVTITARFDAAPVRPVELTVTPAGKGSGGVTSDPEGILCGRDCTQTFATGRTVVLTARASTGSDFAGWSGGGCTGNSECTVTLNESQTVQATFNPKPPAKHFTLTTSTSRGGSIDPACPTGCSYVAGTKVPLTASPGSNTFVTWDGCDTKPTGNACEVTMSQDRTVTVTFTFNVP